MTVAFRDLHCMVLGYGVYWRSCKVDILLGLRGAAHEYPEFDGVQGQFACCFFEAKDMMEQMWMDLCGWQVLIEHNYHQECRYIDPLRVCPLLSTVEIVRHRFSVGSPDKRRYGVTLAELRFVPQSFSS